jgi:hypothetical protein
MMRAIFLILIVAVVALIVAIQTGLVNISQTRDARAPTVSANTNGVTTTAGQTPEFDVQTGSVGVGSREANVALPTLKVERKSKSVSLPVLEVRPPAAKQPPATTNATQ